MCDNDRVKDKFIKIISLRWYNMSKALLSHHESRVNNMNVYRLFSKKLT